jgi:hypothetical protein
MGKYCTLSFVCAWLVGGQLAQAQYLYQESFKNTSASGWVFGADTDPQAPPSSPPVLTAANGIDAPGQGWLRLTESQLWQSSFAFYDSAFAANGTDLTVSFDFATYKGSGIGGADGITFFLFDGATANPSPGASGGSLGYAQRTAVDGLAGGWLGVGFDDFGNFSNPTEGRSGGTGFYPNSVTVRGQGSSDKQNGNYAYLTKNTVTLAQSMDFPNSQNRPDQTTDYRHATVRISADNKLTVQMQYGPGVQQTVIQDYQLPANRPDTFKLGFASATGAGAEIHEIRNLQISSSVPIGPPAISELSSVNIVGIAGMTLFGVHGLVRRFRQMKARAAA